MCVTKINKFVLKTCLMSDLKSERKELVLDCF